MTFLACEVGIVTTYLIRLLWRLNNLGSLPSVVASQKLFLAPWMEASSPLNHPILEFVTLCGNWKATGMSPTLLCSPSCPQSLAQCQGWHWCSLNCWKDGWMDECIGGWKDEWRERWMNGWNDWTDGWMMNEWINEWMDEVISYTTYNLHIYICKIELNNFQLTWEKQVSLLISLKLHIDQFIFSVMLRTNVVHYV